MDPAIDVKDETYKPRNEDDDFNHKLCTQPKLFSFNALKDCD